MDTPRPKIGILTFHRTNNFGSQLQAFGLYQAVRDLGYPCEIIDYRSPALEHREFEAQRPSPRTLKGILRMLLLQPTLDAKAHSLKKFLIDNAKLSRPYTPASLRQSVNDYGKFVVGSDIVWGVDITEGDYAYFLDFVPDRNKKFAFSSSVGNSEAEIDRDTISGLLKDFSEICVREKDAVQWVKRLSGKEAGYVCDPTMLLTAEEWEQYVPPTAYKGKYVLVYFNSDDGKCLRDAIQYAKEHKLKVYLIDYGLPRMGVTRVRPKSLNDFHGLIKGAEAVFSASYHGILFALYFERQLFFYTRSHKERMLSLAEKISFTGRCCDACAPEEAEPMDYSQIRDALTDFRRESLEQLKRILEK